MKTPARRCKMLSASLVQSKSSLTTNLYINRLSPPVSRLFTSACLCLVLTVVACLKGYEGARGAVNRWPTAPCNSRAVISSVYVRKRRQTRRIVNTPWYGKVEHKINVKCFNFAVVFVSRPQKSQIFLPVAGKKKMILELFFSVWERKHVRNYKGLELHLNWWIGSL